MVEIRISMDEDPDKDENEIALAKEGFEILKNISKELLFSGCDRDIRNDDGLTARDIFEQNKEHFDEDELKKGKYILTKPKPCSCLRLTRPIEKVKRNRIT